MSDATDIAVADAVDPDHFIHIPGGIYAGLHLVVDCWGAQDIDDPQLVEQTMRAAALDAGATILGSRVHHFEPNGGVTGVVMLAESHISIHTWPEREYAAIDVFMCGKADPHHTLQRFADAFRTTDIFVQEIRRGWKPQVRRL